MMRCRFAVRPAFWLAAAALLSIVAAAGCASLFGGLPQEEGLHPRLTRFAYLEEGKLVSLAVDTEAARRRTDAEYIPLAVGVANIGLDRLVINRESFTLVDDAGNRYPLAGIKELRASKPNVMYDYRLTAQFRGVYASRFEIWPRMPAVFFPVPSSEPALRDRGVARDRVELSQKTWMEDLLYFPRPEGKLLDRRYELWLDTEQLENPVFVKFAIK
jgi:hypothetical protein